MRILIIILLSIIASACTHSGPVHLYPGDPQPADQLAALTMPTEVDLISLNGKEVSLPHTVDETRTHYLLPGEYDVALRYKKVWADSDNNHEVVDSKLAGITTNLDSGNQLQLITKMPDTLPEAREFAKNIQLVFTNQNGSRIKSRILPETKQNPNLIDKLLNDKGTPFEHLKSWWQAADEKEKAMFREYIKEHP